MDTITYDDFAKLDIRTGTILSAELIAKSKKLVKLEVTFGPEIGNRTILAGIAEFFSTEDLTGTPVLAVLNLEPRTMFGIESHGMILAAKNDDKLSLACCDEEFDDGTRIG